MMNPYICGQHMVYVLTESNRYRMCWPLPITDYEFQNNVWLTKFWDLHIKNYRTHVRPFFGLFSTKWWINAFIPFWCGQTCDIFDKFWWWANVYTYSNITQWVCGFQISNVWNFGGPITSSGYTKVCRQKTETFLSKSTCTPRLQSVPPGYRLKIILLLDYRIQP